MPYRFIMFALSFCLILCGCEPPPPKYGTPEWRHRVQVKVTRFNSMVENDLKPDFKVANVQFPPKQIALLVFKDERDMELWAKNRSGWHFIREFPVLGASGGPGPKLHSGDRQVPEGVYKIAALNPFSKYDVSLKINYPNQYDKLKAQFDHRKHLGGDIYIHGGNLSVGCLAIGNRSVEELYGLITRVGKEHVEVIIAPNDIRMGTPLLAVNRPKWVAELDRNIEKELKTFRRG